MSEPKNEQDLVIQTEMTSLKSWGDPLDADASVMKPNAFMDCGWGKLVFGQTFTRHDALADSMRSEDPGERHIALYLRNPHVALSKFPQELFLDPSHTFRLPLESFDTSASHPHNLAVRPVRAREMKAVRDLYIARHMVPPRLGFTPSENPVESPLYLVAEDLISHRIVGVVVGVDHRHAFNDPDNGSSLWALCVDLKTSIRGVGEALTRRLAEHFRRTGRAFMDLSVLHDNIAAIKLYQKLGFRQIPVYCLKNRNPINEPLFTGPDPAANLSIYSRIIIDEARRRGIAVEVVDAHKELFTLHWGGREVLCRESLTELTSSLAMTVSDDKALTQRLLRQTGLRVPTQIECGDDGANHQFLAQHQRVVVKPARGEQGRGISVDVRETAELDDAIERARAECDQVILEPYIPGKDLRIIVINYEVVAAAVRTPPTIRGDGYSSIVDLIEAQSRRRASATAGESRIPIDGETERCVMQAGFQMDSIPPSGQELTVRKTANLHTGGEIHDVTPQLHPVLADAAVRAAMTLRMPVVGLDFLVPDPAESEYVIIEANERPGLANHEPQPTAERFIDLLFPQTKAQPMEPRHAP
ncbi:N-acetylglutaminylglutamine synthetase [Magnetofaba australis]|uniref:Putative N-acetyltransferase GCN5 n=1 Tax=Magnetofaba australis IT-1 TaxID=1434232 RepID=A0A1Y2K2R4_9PROT|nr:N-acetylglutaminylglutamine synthetase [Magnetofaba australis]OSM02262.1 putative N-acetyltransferase GCN5 [Magnetofaba australis IT-1]